MEKPLLDVLGLDINSLSLQDSSSGRDVPLSSYMSHLSSLTLSSLESTERPALAQSSHSVLLALQALATRSYRSLIESQGYLSSLNTQLALLATNSRALHDAVLAVDEDVQRFSRSYSKNNSNELLQRRSNALLLARNADRLSDILELPSLVSTAISATGTSGTTGTMVSGSSASGSAGYSSALDLHAHVKRLHHLYSNSSLVSSVASQTEEAMQRMTVNIVTSLRSPNLKLAGAMRMIGWLRRVAPDLEDKTRGRIIRPGEGGLGAVLLVCRLANLTTLLGALEPLRELADHESAARVSKGKSSRASSQTNESPWSSGQHTERYLKRYIEIFREQSFAIISMYRNIFPGFTPDERPDTAKREVPSESRTQDLGPLNPIPPPLSTFPLHLVQLLTDTLHYYLPNIRDGAARESLLTQVLYCARSLGRLGGDFSPLLASLGSTARGGGGQGQGDDDDLASWVEVVKKHRDLAGRLDQLASGLGSSGSVKG